MFKFRDKELPLSRRVRDSLTDIFGIGNYRAELICDTLGFGISLNINYLNRYYFDIISHFLRAQFVLEQRLRVMLHQRLEHYLELDLIQGARLFRGLPINGQRTHSNRKTPLRLKPIVSQNRESSEFFVRRVLLIRETDEQNNNAIPILKRQEIAAASHEEPQYEVRVKHKKIRGRHYNFYQNKHETKKSPRVQNKYYAKKKNKYKL